MIKHFIYKYLPWIIGKKNIISKFDTWNHDGIKVCPVTWTYLIDYLFSTRQFKINVSRNSSNVHVNVYNDKMQMAFEHKFDISAKPTCYITTDFLFCCSNINIEHAGTSVCVFSDKLSIDNVMLATFTYNNKCYRHRFYIKYSLKMP